MCRSFPRPELPVETGTWMRQAPSLSFFTVTASFGASAIACGNRLLYSLGLTCQRASRSNDNAAISGLDADNVKRFFLTANLDSAGKPLPGLVDKVLTFAADLARGVRSARVARVAS